jgi:hypothetical protein
VLTGRRGTCAGAGKGGSGWWRGSCSTRGAALQGGAASLGAGRPAAVRTDGKDGGALFPVGRGRRRTVSGPICNFPKF